MTSKSTREIRRQQLRQAILDAAQGIISQGGVGSLNMRAIARAINYSPAAIYEYFDSKATSAWPSTCRRLTARCRLPNT